MGSLTPQVGECPADPPTVITDSEQVHVKLCSVVPDACATSDPLTEQRRVERCVGDHEVTAGSEVDSEVAGFADDCDVDAAVDEPCRGHAGVGCSVDGGDTTPASFEAGCERRPCARVVTEHERRAVEGVDEVSDGAEARVRPGACESPCSVLERKQACPSVRTDRRSVAHCGACVPGGAFGVDVVGVDSPQRLSCLFGGVVDRDVVKLECDVSWGGCDPETEGRFEQVPVTGNCSFELLTTPCFVAGERAQRCKVGGAPCLGGSREQQATVGVRPDGCAASSCA